MIEFFHKGRLQSAALYGSGYIPEYRRILETYYRFSTGNILEWGAGHTTIAAISFFSQQQCRLLLSIDDNPEWLQSVAKAVPPNDFFQPVYKEQIGTCTELPDRGLNYSTFPLSLGKKFDFIFIDGRRRVECAFIASLLSHPQTIAVLHDCKRGRYRPMTALFDVIEDGPAFRVMRVKAAILDEFAGLSEAISDVLGPMASEPPAQTSRNSPTRGRC